MKSVRTWVVLADGAHAKVFEHGRPGGKLEVVPDLTLEVDLPPNRDIVADRPVRSFESQGHARHAKEERSDPHRELKRHTAKTIAQALEACLPRFDRLVLVAPPKALGDLRAALSKAVREKVVAELAHDLIKTPYDELPGHLSKVLPPVAGE